MTFVVVEGDCEVEGLAPTLRERRGEVVAFTVPEVDMLWLGEEVTQMVGEVLLDWLGLLEELGEAVNVALLELVVEKEPKRDPVGVWLVVALPVAARIGLGVGVALVLPQLVTVGVSVGLMEAPADAVASPEVEGVKLPLGLTVAVMSAVPLAPGVKLEPAMREGVEAALPLDKLLPVPGMERLTLGLGLVDSGAEALRSAEGEAALEAVGGMLVRVARALEEARPVEDKTGVPV